MNKFLQKIGLLDNLQVELKIDKNIFLQKLNSIIDNEGWNPFEIFNTSGKMYKGKIEFNKFNLKKKRRFLDINNSKVNGEFSIDGEKVLINSTIKSFNAYLVIYLAFLVLMFIIFISNTISNNINGDNTFPVFLVPFFIFQIALMIALPYLGMKQSVKKMKYDFERELFFFTKLD